MDLNWQVRHELTRNEGIEKVRSWVSENTSKLANVKKINIRCYVTFSFSFNFLLVQRANLFTVRFQSFSELAYESKNFAQLFPLLFAESWNDSKIEGHDKGENQGSGSLERRSPGQNSAACCGSEIGPGIQGPDQGQYLVPA